MSVYRVPVAAPTGITESSCSISACDSVTRVAATFSCSRVRAPSLRALVRVFFDSSCVSLGCRARPPNTPTSNGVPARAGDIQTRAGCSENYAKRRRARTARNPRQRQIPKGARCRTARNPERRQTAAFFRSWRALRDFALLGIPRRLGFGAVWDFAPFGPCAVSLLTQRAASAILPSRLWRETCRRHCHW